MPHRQIVSFISHLPHFATKYHTRAVLLTSKNRRCKFLLITTFARQETNRTEFKTVTGSRQSTELWSTITGPSYNFHGKLRALFENFFNSLPVP